MNPYRDTDREAREAVRKFRRTLPACIRRTVRYIGLELIVGAGRETVKAIFEDVNGRHVLTISE